MKCEYYSIKHCTPFLLTSQLQSQLLGQAQLQQKLETSSLLASQLQSQLLDQAQLQQKLEAVEAENAQLKKANKVSVAT